jgi:hypothetical protein
MLQGAAHNYLGVVRGFPPCRGTVCKRLILLELLVLLELP